MNNFFFILFFQTATHTSTIVFFFLFYFLSSLQFFFTRASVTLNQDRVGCTATNSSPAFSSNTFVCPLVLSPAPPPPKTASISRSASCAPLDSTNAAPRGAVSEGTRPTMSTRSSRSKPGKWK